MKQKKDVPGGSGRTGQGRRKSAENANVNRREFIVAAGVVGAAAVAGVRSSEAQAAPPNGMTGKAAATDQLAHSSWVTDGKKRQQLSYNIRKYAAQQEKKRPVIEHVTNGDEERYASRIGNFSKSLPHDPVTGEVDPDAYDAFLYAVSTARFEDFEAIPAGDGGRTLANPMGGIGFNIYGPDHAAIRIDAPPALASPEFAAQMAELYWMACIRDVPFAEYDTHPVAIAAREDLAAFSGYTGPSDGGVIRAQDLFRVDFPGVQVGPMVSQYFYRNFTYDGISIVPKIDEPAPEENMIDWARYVEVQNGGGGPRGIPTLETTVYPRTARDLGKIAGSDRISSMYLRATMIQDDPEDAANPYNDAERQGNFATFGIGHLAELIGSVHRGERHAWFQKWFVHRFLRPEAGGARVHRIMADGADYPIHDDLMVRSSVLDCVHDKFGTYLLPQMFGRGSPRHPSCPAGHAITAGACVTVLKAWVDEEGALDFDPVEPTPDGQELVPYVGPALTVGGELNKLAHNLSFGRDMSGVHWRADDVPGMLQGEELAIRILREEKAGYPESFEGFSLTKFNGETITI